MPKQTFKSVDDYLTAQPESVRKALEQVRRAIRKALPDADEVISYNVPTYKWQNATVLHFAGWKKHYSLYGATKAVVRAFKDDLGRYDLEKGTIRFPLEHRVPTGLIARIARFRARELATAFRSAKRKAL
jgi:uncharacterized protein YdhG (YjbR/CyaY superfamily)